MMLPIYMYIISMPQSSRSKELNWARLTRDDQIGKVRELEEVDEYRVEAI
jgi:hypothetical protein